MSKFLSLRRPTTISKLASLVPQHPDALPQEIIPQWADLQPSAKLPDRCCPVHAKDFSRGEVGQALWEFPPQHGFDLQDPCNRVVRRTYEVLHDKHLCEFWTESLWKVKQAQVPDINLKRRDLINREDGRVTCTLMELNEYRNFLFQHYRLQLQRLLNRLANEKSVDDHNTKVQIHMENVPDFAEKLTIRRQRAAGIFGKKMEHQGSLLKLPSFQVRSEIDPSRVSIGPVEIVEHYETESFSLKQCRNRPPTPVTSVTSLVECTMRQSHEERASVSALEVSTETALDILRRIRSDSYPLIHVMYSQRRYLEGNLLKYGMIVQPYVIQRVLAAIDLERLSIVSDFDGGEDSSSPVDERESILLRTANALLRFPESNHQYAIALCDSVHFLSVQAIRKIQQILNAP
uniref:Uncharacterized protein n=1 Tax=Anopheles epiroticus TaxID=199890 RepID=A0A182P5E6_9DIPT